MLKVLFTLDYEIHGNGDGCPYELMVEPTNRMMDLFDRYGAKLTIMADIAEILKFREYRDRTGRDDYHYEAIANQLRDAVRRGHDVQLHLHASYCNAEHRGDAGWSQDWSEYNFAGLPLERQSELIGIGKKYLEELLKPVAANYECFVFRAANWSVSPSRNVVHALLNNGIRIDSSVFKHGKRSGIVTFDYTAAPSELVPWRVDANEICKSDETGRLLEIPIYCEQRWIGAFLSPNRIYRAYLTRKHRVRNFYEPVQQEKISAIPKSRRSSRLQTLFRPHAWKADFNQCSGRQLTRALRRADSRYGNSRNPLPFVLIGHSKLFTKFNEWDLRSFLATVTQNSERFAFGRFDEFDTAGQLAAA
jgi:hypothetical protein